jgi:hypothetical protein
MIDTNTFKDAASGLWRRGDWLVESIGSMVQVLFVMGTAYTLGASAVQDVISDPGRIRRCPC